MVINDDDLHDLLSFDWIKNHPGALTLELRSCVCPSMASLERQVIVQKLHAAALAAAIQAARITAVQAASGLHHPKQHFPVAIL